MAVNNIPDDWAQTICDYLIKQKFNYTRNILICPISATEQRHINSFIFHFQ